MHKVLFLLAVVSTISFDAKAEMLSLTNPAFEDGKTGWTDDKGVSQASTEAAKDGKGGLRVSDTNEQDYVRVVSEPVAVLPGKNYKLTFYARQVSGHGVNGILYFLDKDGELIKAADGSRALAGPPDDGNTNWRKFEVIQTAPANAASAQIYVQSNRVAVALVDFDEFQIEQID